MYKIFKGIFCNHLIACKEGEMSIIVFIHDCIIWFSLIQWILVLLHMSVCLYICYLDGVYLLLLCILGIDELNMHD